MEQIVDPQNLDRAWRRVKKNRGAPGPDGMTIRNLLRPSFYRMLRDVFRFNRNSVAILESADLNLTLGEYLAKNEYSSEFVDHALPLPKFLQGHDRLTANLWEED